MRVRVRVRVEVRARVRARVLRLEPAVEHVLLMQVLEREQHLW